MAGGLKGIARDARYRNKGRRIISVVMTQAQAIALQKFAIDNEITMSDFCREIIVSALQRRGVSIDD